MAQKGGRPKGSSRCHPKTVEVRITPMADPWESVHARRSQLAGDTDTQAFMGRWRSGAAEAASAAIDALDAFVAAGEDISRKDSPDLYGAVARAMGDTVAIDMFWNALETAREAGLSTTRTREILIQLKERLASANLSGSGEVVLRAPSQRGPDGQMDSTEMMYALSLLRGGTEYLFHPTGADSFLALAPTAKEFAKLVTSVPEALAKSSQVAVVSDEPERLKDELVERFHAGQMDIDELYRQVSAATDAAAVEMRRAREEMKATIRQLPPTSQQYLTLAATLDFYTAYADYTAPLFSQGLEPGTLPESPEQVDRLSEIVAQRMGRGRGPDGAASEPPSASAPASQVTSARTAVQAVADALRATLSSPEAAVPYATVLRQVTDDLRSHPDLAGLSAGEVSEVCRLASRAVQEHQLAMMEPYGADAWGPGYHLDKTGRELPHPGPAHPSGLFHHLETFVRELQTPEMTGNADASRSMAKLMFAAVANSADAVRYTYWRPAEGEEGLRVRGGQGRELSIGQAQDRHTREFARDQLPLIHDFSGPYRGVSVTPVIATLAPHLPEDSIAALGEMLDLSDGWQDRAASGLMSSCGMTAKGAREHVSRLAAALGSRAR